MLEAGLGLDSRETIIWPSRPSPTADGVSLSKIWTKRVIKDPSNDHLSNSMHSIVFHPTPPSLLLYAVDCCMVAPLTHSEQLPPIRPSNNTNDKRSQ